MPAVHGSRNLSERLSVVAERALSFLSFDNSTVEIFLLSGKEMLKLEKRVGLRKAAGHTPNVLSFTEPIGFPRPETKKRILGEVYVNKDLAKHGFGELAYLLVHGILHLIGYSHTKKNDILQMEALEKKICEKIFRDIA
ncbi:MAG: hypothetical protein A3B25_00570 [Candidatus Ryanbacteria bacterium RIFCSPLOWO2_01_FULL_48_26]|uniref:Uncharacterized protein n=1 Tax=Candidatus Ryanbacteria bacterium RIFCSPLOWO2_01_FULL_48_26 TaxID=1802126 RepID=A0A1G2GTQ1_9BACT|nr:MAG: hypothetical protein A3B25_00570 [Candidatus Ryanbacteria bacterium RIFCSPLOWO2_01_FULL_48_26]